MKKLMCIALMLALLAGCTAPQDGTETPDTEPRPPMQEVVPLEPAVNENERFSRTEIIRRGDRLEGFFLTARAWVQEYAGETWPGSEVTVTYDSGFAAPEKMFTDFLGGGATMWSLTVSQPAGAALETTVQVLYFQDGGSIWLSGLLEGDDVLLSRPEVYDYLRLDTRFAARMRDLPELTPPEGLTGSYELTELFGSENGRVVLLDRNTAVCCDGTGGRAAVVDLDSGATLWESALPPAASWGAETVRDGVFTATGYDADGGRIQVLYASREELRVATLYPEAAYRWPMGSNRFVESWENSLYQVTVDPSTGAEDRVLLLAGVYAQDDTSAAFSFREAISDDLFLYDYWGYEWLNRSGVFDLATGEDAFVTVPVTENGETGRRDCALLWADAETAIAAVPDYGYYLFSVTDRFGSTELLTLGHEDAAHRAEFAAVSEDGARLLLRSAADDGSLFTFELFDRAGTRLWSWTLDGGITGDVSCGLTADGTVYITFYSLLTGSYQLYVAAV